MITTDIIEFVRTIIQSTDMHEARDRCIDFLASHAVKKIQIRIPSTYEVVMLDPVDFDRIQASVTEGMVVQAIKDFRTLTGLGIKDAKESVQLPQNFKQKPTQE